MDPATEPSIPPGMDPKPASELGFLPSLIPVLAKLAPVTPYLSLVLAATACIYLGAHATLRRPPSAATPTITTAHEATATPRLRRARRRQGLKLDTETKFASGLVASDVIVLPLVAGAVLVTLYYVIVWLQDPALLNRLLRAYFGLVSVGGLYCVVADALALALSVVFPAYWRDARGVVWVVDGERNRTVPWDWWAGERTREQEADTAAVDSTRAYGGRRELALPLPGPFATLKLSRRTARAIWAARRLTMDDWILRFDFLGETSTTNLSFAEIVAGVIAPALAAVFYLTEVGDAWLSNLIGFATSYAAFLVISPTTFALGSGVLAGLFIYDIVMVFYTPFMVTVATSLDVPIKLVAKTAQGSSMLGLGDVVVPGMMIAMALRFDLHQFYARRATTEAIPLESETTDGAVSKTLVEVTRKPEYLDPQGLWGSRLWTWRPTMARRRESVAGGAGLALPPDLAAAAFPKPYFCAAVVGYVGGMAATLVALFVYNHAQPALLYLVPGVLGSLWTTALVRGEIKHLWGYTEDGMLDKVDVVVELDGEGKLLAKKDGPGAEGGEGSAKDGAPSARSASPSPTRSRDEGSVLFALSVSMPSILRA